MKLHIFPASPNARKAIMVNEHTGFGADVAVVNIPEGAHKQPEYLALNPNGKVPTLEYDDGSTLWESNVIINKMAGEKESELWPATNQRYDILRWQFWEACHWTPACNKFISKHIFKNDSVDVDAASAEFVRLAKVLDDHLDGRAWLSGDTMTTADVSVNAILCYRAPCHYPLAGFDNIAAWIARIEALSAWQVANPPPESP